jgi:RNA polymerase sigma-70 factor, ECF subfamily
VLKISIISDSDQAIQFQLEGKLVGPWVEELQRLSDEALSDRKAVSLDLEKVWFVDPHGVTLLRDLARRQVSQLNCSQFVSQQLKEAAQMMAASIGTELLSQNPKPLNECSSMPAQLQGAESQLIRAVHAGNAAAFYELVRPYERAVFLAALSIVKNDADAEEVAQEAVLKAFKGLSRFRHEAKFSTWLIQITINEAKMKLRKDRRHLYESMDEGQQNEEGDYIPKDFADWREIPSEALEQRELCEALTKALESLPEKYRTVLILRDVQHLSINETAKALGLSEANVKTRLSRARLQMRDALARLASMGLGAEEDPTNEFGLSDVSSYYQ